ncbi:MAG: hypothetical protein M0R30_00185 [Methanoregula sp.]|uniref:hypothetical protein n=1 Tax=Methanoregula sp. TaxID=2052170 RepID=UPI0025E3A977|nr:hypothetical protein [Methanoregula sp.]MCK9630038.1 hypothetical protein [Methanoregula sp.]
MKREALEALVDTAEILSSPATIPAIKKTTAISGRVGQRPSEPRPNASPFFDVD